MVSAKSRLCHICKVHAHLMIPATEIKLGEESSTLQLVQQVINDGNGNLFFTVLSFKA
jgi:hypothetical protein